MFGQTLDPMSQPLLYLVRHGATEANDEGKFRGHLDYPLDDSGIQSAEDAAYFLCFRNVGFLAASPLRRAYQTADRISQSLMMGYDRNPGLMPWNIGRFAGKSREKYKTDLEWYVNNPDEVILDGESLSAFQKRFADTLYRYIAQASYQQPGILVTHSSGITAANVALDKEFAGQGPGMIDIVEPGGIVAVHIGPDDRAKLVPILGEVVHDSTTTFT
jgi:broad specificity phosphatase PhoE